MLSAWSPKHPCRAGPPLVHHPKGSTPLLIDNRTQQLLSLRGDLRFGRCFQERQELRAGGVAQFVFLPSSHKALDSGLSQAQTRHMPHACDSSIWEVQGGGSEAKSSLSYILYFMLT